MLIVSKHNARMALKVTGRKFLNFFFIAATIGISSDYFGFHDYLLPSSIITMFAAAVGIFLAFRINAGYGRWWEARGVWGELINNSRSFASYVSTLMRQSDTPTADEKALHSELIRGHIGFLNALRLQLRQQKDEDWEKELWKRKINNKPLFNNEEIQKLKQVKNKATQINQMQSEKIANYFKNQKPYKHVKIVELIRFFFIAQGSAEKIKTTVFAWGYAFYTHRLVWSLAFIITASQVNNGQIQNILLVSFISTAFVTIEQVGRNLDNPFEHSFNDTPISSICRIIEIDILQQIGEPCELAAIEVENGCLN